MEKLNNRRLNQVITLLNRIIPSKWVLLGSTLVICILLIGCERRPDDDFIVTNEHFAIRVQLKLQLADFQYQYRFQSKSADSELWKDVLIRSNVDPSPFCRGCLRIVGDKIGFFFIGNIFAVTTNAGENWYFFDVAKDSAFGRLFPNNTRISFVEIDKNGTGKMQLEKYDNESTVVEFVTYNYGQTWKESKIHK